MIAPPVQRDLGQCEWSCSGQSEKGAKLCEGRGNVLVLCYDEFDEGKGKNAE